MLWWWCKHEIPSAAVELETTNDCIRIGNLFVAVESLTLPVTLVAGSQKQTMELIHAINVTVSHVVRKWFMTGVYHYLLHF